MVWVCSVLALHHWHEKAHGHALAEIVRHLTGKEVVYSGTALWQEVFVCLFALL